MPDVEEFMKAWSKLRLGALALLMVVAVVV
jgi:hypothetical protein